MEFSDLPIELKAGVAFGSADIPNWMTLAQYKELRRTIPLVSKPLWEYIRNTFDRVVFVLTESELETEEYVNFCFAEYEKVQYAYITFDLMSELCKPKPGPVAGGEFAFYNVDMLKRLGLLRELRVFGLCKAECLKLYGDLIYLHIDSLEYIYAPTRWLVLSHKSKTPRLKKIQSSMVTQLVEEVRVSADQLTLNVPFGTAFQRFERKLVLEGDDYKDDSVKLVRSHFNANVKGLNPEVAAQLKCVENAEMLFHNKDQNLVWGKAGGQTRLVQFSTTDAITTTDVALQLLPVNALYEGNAPVFSYNLTWLERFVESDEVRDRIFWWRSETKPTASAYKDLEDRSVLDLTDLDDVQFRVSSVTWPSIVESLVFQAAATDQNKVKYPIEWSGILYPPSTTMFNATFDRHTVFRPLQRVSEVVYDISEERAREFFHSRQVTKWCINAIHSQTDTKTISILPSAAPVLAKFLDRHQDSYDVILTKRPKSANLMMLLKLFLYHIL
jgi:hypothetical protein